LFGLPNNEHWLRRSADRPGYRRQAHTYVQVRQACGTGSGRPSTKWLLALAAVLLLLSGCGDFWVDASLDSIIVTDDKGITTPAVDVGQTVQMRATGKFNDGSRDTISAVWTSSEPTVATIDSSTGLLTALSSGTTTVSAANTGVTGTASVTVCGAEQVITISPDNPILSLASGSTHFTATAGGINVTDKVT